MKDEEYLFHSDCREKKNIARSARCARTHNGKGGRVKFPSDYLTKKELNAMNGEMKSYRLNDPMSWGEFKAMPDDLKITYIKALRETYNAPDLHIARMMGTNTCTFSNEMGRLGLRGGKVRKSNTPWDKDGFYAWYAGSPATAVDDPVVEPEPVVEVVEPIPVPVKCQRAIPDTGKMTFTGNVVQIAEALVNLLGDANVLIGITWDVLEEGDG